MLVIRRDTLRGKAKVRARSGVHGIIHEKNKIINDIQKFCLLHK